MSTTDSESTPEETEESEVKSDEEWKQRVKAEDAALEASLKTEASVESEESEAATQSVEETSEPSTDDADSAAADSMPMPPATFEMLVSMFSTQAMVAMGMIPNPATGKAETTPDLAKHFIDLLGVLETKTAGNLEPQEQSLLDSSLHSLRMAFVQATK